MESEAKCCLCQGSFEKGKGKQLKYKGRSCGKERDTLELLSKELGLSQMLPTGGSICYSCLSTIRKFNKLTTALAGLKEELKMLLMKSPRTQAQRKKRTASECEREDRSLQGSTEIDGNQSTQTTNAEEQANGSEDPIDVNVSFPNNNNIL